MPESYLAWNFLLINWNSLNPMIISWKNLFEIIPEVTICGVWYHPLQNTFMDFYFNFLEDVFCIFRKIFGDFIFFSCCFFIQFWENSVLHRLGLLRIYFFPKSSQVLYNKGDLHSVFNLSHFGYVVLFGIGWLIMVA